MEKKIAKNKKAFHFYFESLRPKLKAEGISKEKDIITEITRRYKLLCPEEMKIYKKMEKEDQARFEKEIQNDPQNDVESIQNVNKNKRNRKQVNYYESDQEDEPREKSKRPKFSTKRQNKFCDQENTSVSSKDVPRTPNKIRIKSISKLKSASRMNK